MNPVKRADGPEMMETIRKYLKYKRFLLSLRHTLDEIKWVTVKIDYLQFGIKHTRTECVC